MLIKNLLIYLSAFLFKRKVIRRNVQSMEKSIRVVLVHGTWPDGLVTKRLWNGLRKIIRIVSMNNFYKDFEYGVRWDREHSTFRKELSKRFLESGSSVSISSFEWDGSNTFWSRENAAKNLACRLNLMNRSDCKTKIFVIGHSHGGTVACKAVDFLEECNNVKIITLGTPFLEMRQGGRLHYTSDRIMACMCVATLMMFCLGIFAHGIAIDISGIAIYVLLIYYITRQLNKLRNGQSSIIGKEIKDLCSISSLAGVSKNNALSMVIRTPYDNALVALNIVSIIESKMRNLMNSFEEASAWSAMLAALTVSAFLIVQATYYKVFYSGFIPLFMVIKYSISAVMTLMSITLVSFFARKIILKFYGARFWDNSFDVEVCLNTSPDTYMGCMIRTIIPEINRKLNRHSIYENKEVFEIIYRHIKYETL